MTEEWKDIVGYEGYYRVSNLGNVLGQNYNKTGKSRRLALNKISNGYLRVTLSVDGIRTEPKVHQLVARAFIPNPENKLTVNHKNEDKTDNRVENLEWMTQKENNNYGTHNKRVGLTHRDIGCKIVSQYTLRGERVRDWKSINEIERELGYSDANLIRCCKGIVNSAYGYVWRYGDESFTAKVRTDMRPRRRPVRQYGLDGTLIREFVSCSDASRDMGVHNSVINACCRGKQETSCGYIWRYSA